MAIFKPFLFVILFQSIAAQASILPFFNESDWRSALPGAKISVNDFEGSLEKLPENSSGHLIGDISVAVQGGKGDPGPTGLSGKGYFQAEVDSSGTDQLAVEFSFGAMSGLALTGLQNDSVSTPHNLNLSEIAIGIGAEHWILSDLLNESKASIPFLGFVSDQPFDSLQFFHARLLTGKGGTSEEFYLDGLQLATLPVTLPAPSSTATVAEPAGILLMLAGSVGLAVFRSKRNRPSIAG